jgi:hypothetical protein
MTYWFLLVREISAGVVEGESNRCGGLKRNRISRRQGAGLAAGDPLGALNWVALRDDAPALAIRSYLHGAARFSPSPAQRTITRRSRVRDNVAVRPGSSQGWPV